MNPDVRRFGPYEILEKLGHGGMGLVFKARSAAQDHLGADDVVALKIANWMVVNEPVLAQRFLNEYTITRQLDHPNLVHVLGYGVEHELPYLVLEYGNSCSTPY